MRFDFGAIKNLPFLLELGIGGDDHVLSSIVRFLEDKGYRVRGAGDVAPELLAGEGTLGAKAPSAEDRGRYRHRPFGWSQALGRLDVGQAAVVAKGHVLAVEAAEGTDAMLARCAELGEGSVAVATVRASWSRRRSPGKKSASTCRRSGRTPYARPRKPGLPASPSPPAAC